MERGTVTMPNRPQEADEQVQQRARGIQRLRPLSQTSLSLNLAFLLASWVTSGSGLISLGFVTAKGILLQVNDLLRDNSNPSPAPPPKKNFIITSLATKPDVNQHELLLGLY